MGYIIFGIIIFIIIILITRIKIVPQAQVYIVERLGTFYSEWSTGPHFLVPFLDRVAKKVSIKDQIVDFKPQSVITKDNVSMQIDTVVFFRLQTQSSMPTALNVRYLQLKILPPQLFVILSEIWSLMKLLPQGTE